MLSKIHHKMQDQFESSHESTNQVFKKVQEVHGSVKSFKRESDYKNAIINSLKQQNLEVSNKLFLNQELLLTKYFHRIIVIS